MDFNVIGGEAQLYLTDFTIYGQGGYLDGDGDQLKNAGFGRGVLRWFTTEDSRLQGEVSYVSGDDGEDDLTVLEWAARYDTVLSGLPIIGDTNVFVGYRGARFDNSDDGKYFDHTVMIGFRTWFGGNTMREFDRVGATLDAPDFGRWSVSD